MPTLNFPEWTPDAVDLGSPGGITITNVLPGRVAYKPFPSLSVITGATTARPRGAIEAEDTTLTSYQYVGDATKLYELNETALTWTDVSNGTYTTGTEEVWEFVRWENKILAVNWNDNPQQITMGAANFSDLTTALKARRIGVVGDFVVMGNTYDSTDGNRPNRIRWSAQGDETDFTVSPSTQSDFRDLTSGGAVQKILGGEVGIIVSRESTFRMTYEGAPVVFRIDEVLPDIGALSGGSCCRLGDEVYFLSDQGFIELTGNGTGVNRIGAGKVDQYVIEDLDHDHLSRISCVADPTSNRIAWAYPGSGATAGRPNKIIIYDRTFDKWSIAEDEVELILRTKGIAFTLDELDNLGYTDIDAMTVSLDSNQWQSKATQFSAFDENFALGFFRGAPMTATLETRETELHEGRNAHLNAFHPLVDTGSVTAVVGYRDRLSDAVTYTSSLNQSASGRFTKRVNSRFFRFKLTITGNDWTDAIGVQINPEEAPRGERRG